MKKIFVTGGAGYVGSHCVISLVKHGYIPIILDNFSNSQHNTIKNLENITKRKIVFYDVDIRNKKKLVLIFKKHRSNCVIHCAGLKAIKESIEKPITYFNNNIVSTLTLLECMQEEKIYNLIFSSSATVYDSTQPLPWKETGKVGEIKNPYGTSKFVIEKILIDLAKFNKKWNIKILRYFNPISNHSSGLISDNPKGISDNLIPYIVKVAKKQLPYLKIYGNNYPTKDGTCIRDYIHVMDLAEAHISMLKKNKQNKGLKIYNLGTGRGSSILEVIRAFEKETGINIPFKFVKRRLGDVAISFCNPKKAFKEVKWKSHYNLNKAMIDLKKIILN